MLARLLIPFALLALTGCIPTGGTKCGSCATPEAPPEDCAVTANEESCCSKCPKTTAEEAACCESSKATVAGVELKNIKFDDLSKAIEAHKGKVVVVDIWANFCVPCKKEFPHLVKIHETMHDKGVVCISVSVDEPEQHAAALAFLQKSGAKFANYRLEDPNTVWQEKWDLNGIPAVFVYDRDGKQAAKFSFDDPDNQFTYEANVLPLVQKLATTK